MTLYSLFIILIWVAAIITVVVAWIKLGWREAFAITVIAVPLAWVLLYLLRVFASPMMHEAKGTLDTVVEVSKDPNKTREFDFLDSSFGSPASPHQPQQQPQSPQQSQQAVSLLPTPEPPKPPEKGDTKWEDDPRVVLQVCYDNNLYVLIQRSLQQGGLPVGVQWRLEIPWWKGILPKGLEGEWTMSISILGVGSWQLALDSLMAHTIKDQWGDEGIGKLPWPRVPMVYDGTQWVPNGDCVWP